MYKHGGRMKCFLRTQSQVGYIDRQAGAYRLVMFMSL